MEGTQGFEHLHLAVQKFGIFETGLSPHFVPMCRAQKRPVAPAPVRLSGPSAMQVRGTSFVDQPAGQA